MPADGARFKQALRISDSPDIALGRFLKSVLPLFSSEKRRFSDEGEPYTRHEAGGDLMLIALNDTVDVLRVGVERYTSRGIALVVRLVTW